ncbi:MAG: phenylalanine--tRNA ligase subunit alpha, partial [Alphaproteobacteria bacterium]|nr:phenylalanine--tRNA ligase subunit alpha [Alphaproteobacteria bacterium]
MTNDLQHDFFNALTSITSLQALDDLRVHYFGKQGAITEALKSLGKMSPDERKIKGAAINVVRDACQTALSAKKCELENAAINAKLTAEKIDITLPSLPSL